MSLLCSKGGCHCGAVRFEVSTTGSILVQRCNCSICHACGYLHLIVPAERFHLLRGADALTEYRFNTGIARHLFCKVCGIKSFYVPRSNPDGYSVNANCVDWDEKVEVTIEEFDGQNWEQHAHGLKHLSDQH